MCRNLLSNPSRRAFNHERHRFGFGGCPAHIGGEETLADPLWKATHSGFRCGFQCREVGARYLGALLEERELLSETPTFGDPATFGDGDPVRELDDVVAAPGRHRQRPDPIGKCRCGEAGSIWPPMREPRPCDGDGSGPRFRELTNVMLCITSMLWLSRQTLSSPCDRPVSISSTAGGTSMATGRSAQRHARGRRPFGNERRAAPTPASSMGCCANSPPGG